MSTHGGGSASDVYSKILKSPTTWLPTSSSVKFGRGGRVDEHGSRPIDELIAQVAGAHAPDEMVYLEDRINGQKMVFFGGGTKDIQNRYKDALPDLMRASMMMAYLSDQTIATHFHTAAARIHTFWGKIDKAVAAAKTAHGNSSTVKFAEGMNFANAYKSWHNRFVEAQLTNWKAWKDEQLKAALGDISAHAASDIGTPAVAELVASVKKHEQSDLGDAQFVQKVHAALTIP
jgi:hypothetical protein